MARRDPLRSVARQAEAAQEGLRRLTRAELEHLGRSPTSRAYTSQRAGIQLRSLRADAVVSRRQAEQKVLGTTFERVAETKRAERGGYSPTDAYYNAVRTYAKRNGMTVKDARSDPHFRELYRTAYRSRDSRRTARKRTQETKTAKTREQSRKRLRALRDLGVFDEDEFLELYESYKEIDS